MIVVHAAIITCEDYAARRAPYRQAHIARLVRLREEGQVVGGGPAPDGRSVDLFYRLTRPEQLGALVEEDPYSRAGVWTGYRGRAFAQFVEPWEVPPVVLDGSRRVTIAEGPVVEPDLAQLALVELRGAGRLVFGGFLDQRETLAVLRSPDAAEATGWLVDTGVWAPDGLRTRPLFHVV